MSPAVKNAILLVVLLGAVGASAFFFVRGSKDSGYADDPKLSTDWRCVKCSWTISLTPAKQKEWEKGDKIKREKGLRQTIFMCPQCNAYTVTRAERCSKHNVMYNVRDAEGNSVGCAECNKELAE